MRLIRLCDDDHDDAVDDAGVDDGYDGNDDAFFLLFVFLLLLFSPPPLLSIYLRNAWSAIGAPPNAELGEDSIALSLRDAARY